MRDCENVDIRDLLPEHAAGRLAGAERARVEAHVASCEACRDELALLRAVRAARPAPRVTAADVSRIVAALPKPPGLARSRPAASPASPATPGVVSLEEHRARRAPAGRALPWRRVAAIAAVLVGAVGVGVFGRGGRGTGGENPLELGPETTLVVTTPVVTTPAESTPRGEPTRVAVTPRESVPTTRRGTATVAQTTDALGALGGIASGADEEELEALIAGLESLSGVPDVETGEESTDGGGA